MVLRSLFLFLLLASAGAPTPASAATLPGADADLAWLNRYLSANASGRSSGRAQSGSSVPFADLKTEVGAPVRLTLSDGSKRFGVLTEANSREAALRIRVGAGHYLYRFAPGDVSRIEAL